MKICLFGASGYVGASIYKKLKDVNDIEVSGTYLDQPAMFDDLVKLDINEPESFSNYYKKEKPDIVIWSVMDGPNEHDLTDKGLMNLITFLTPETKLIYISSDFVFSDGKGPYTEDNPLSTLPDDHIFSTYTNAKVKAERLINNELSNFVILRAGPIYGENQIGKLDDYTDQLSYHLRSGKSIAFRDDLIRTFIHVEDLADVIVKMVKHDETGVFNIGPSTADSFYKFMQAEAEKMGYSPELVEKAKENEEADQGIPKNISLITEKINKKLKLKFR